MNKSEYKNIYINEESHFYYKANHAIVLDLMRQYLNKGTSRLRSKIKILDAGCGTGLLASKLERFGSVIGLDYSEEALKFARKRGVKVKKGSIEKLPFPDNSFDVVTSIDVVNHLWVVDISKAFKEFNRVLKPEGVLILRVSANPWLVLNHDKHVQISHRFSKDELKKAFIKAKFRIIRLSYINMVLLPLAIMKYLVEKIALQKDIESGIEKIPGPFNTLLFWLISIERYLLRYWDIPFGIGLVMVAKKSKACHSE